MATAVADAGGGDSGESTVIFGYWEHPPGAYMTTQKNSLLLLIAVVIISGCSLLPPHEEPQHGSRARVRVNDINVSLISFSNSSCENRRDVASINGFMLDHFTSRGMPPRLSSSTPAIEAYVNATKPFYGVFHKSWPGYFASDFCKIPFTFSPKDSGDYEIDAVYAGKDPTTNKEYCRLRINQLLMDKAGEFERKEVSFEKLGCD